MENLTPVAVFAGLSSFWLLFFKNSTININLYNHFVTVRVLVQKEKMSALASPLNISYRLLSVISINRNSI